MPQQGQAIDYAALADQVRANAPIDYAALADQVRSQSSGADFPDLEKQIANNPFRAIQLPFERLGAKATKAHDALADQMLSDAAKGRKVSKVDYVKSFLLGSGADAANMAGSTLSPEGVAVGTATALAPEVMGPVLVGHGLYKAAENAPGAVKGQPEAVSGALGGLAEAAGVGIASDAVLTGETPVQQVWRAKRGVLQRLSGAMQTPAEAAQLPAGSRFSPAKAVSNQDVINWADGNGIDLSPAQATRDRAARYIQGTGEATLTPGGQQLQDAMQENNGKLEQQFENNMRSHDPHNLGASPESAGTALKTSAKVALENAKAQSEIAYKQAGLDSANIVVPNLRNRLASFVDGIRNVTNPQDAATHPEYQGPAVEAALNDIENKIKDSRLGPNATVQSVRNLRTELWEKANDYSGTIPDAAKRIYAMASQIPDDAMIEVSKGTNFEKSFRDASAQWKSLKSKFDAPGEPLTNILQTTDARQAYNSIVGGKSADVIAKLKAENIDLAPIQSQVLRDIAGKGFRLSGNTLAGYPDGFLQELFGPQGARELYVQSEVGRRMGWNINPSESGKLLIAKDQIGWNPASWVRGEAAARASMPRNPKSFVSATPAAPPSFSALRPGTLSLRALMTAGTQGLAQPGSGR